MLFLLILAKINQALSLGSGTDLLCFKVRSGEFVTPTTKLKKPKHRFPVLVGHKLSLLWGQLGGVGDKINSHPSPNLTIEQTAPKVMFSRIDQLLTLIFEYLTRKHRTQPRQGKQAKEDNQYAMHRLSLLESLDRVGA
ncbi:MAG: hypothetical protein RPU91_07700 [Candidatus Sedimenticola sp. (ex Thyasira tokunagai)]